MVAMMYVVVLVVCILVPNIRFTQGQEDPFTVVPLNPSFVTLGSDEKFKWDFTIGADFKHVAIQYEDGGFKVLVIKKRDGTVEVNPAIALPKNLTSRVTITGHATFAISNIQLEDTERKYRCSYVRTAGAPTTKGAIQLVVIKPAENVTVTPESQSKELGENATFECTADGVPPPKLYWKDGNNKTVEDGNNIEINSTGGLSLITFKSLTSSNHGIYTCNVNDSDVKESASGVIAVPFCEAIGKVQSAYIACVGMTVSLVCPLDGFPKPYITWTYPNGSSKSSNSITSLFLTVSDKAFGTYNCSGCGKTFGFKLEKALHPTTPTTVDEPKDCTPEKTALGILIPVLVIIIIILAVLLWKAMQKGNSTSHQSKRLEAEELNKGSQNT